MVLAHLLLIFLPAFALSSKDSVTIVPAEDLKVCEYFDARIVRLGEIVNEELRPDVDVASDLYITLEESKLCDTVGYVAIPECVANNEGDECIARKTSELIRKYLRAAMKAEKIKDLPSGEKFFATCKHIGYKNVLKTFKSARSLMSAECGLPGQKHGNRHARNADLLPALLLAGSYDPSSIWFQYFLCKDIDLYCYFFTQGWTQGQYGQYYLYDNLLDDNTGLFAGSTDSSNLATIALLGGLGGGIGQPSGYYPSYGAHAAAPAQGRKRREAEDEDEDGHDDGHDEKHRKRSTAINCKETPNHPDCPMRKRRAINCEEEDHPSCRKTKRGAINCDEMDHPSCPERKRRAINCDEEDHPSCPERKREAINCDKEDHPSCLKRKREAIDCDEEDHPSCLKRKRQAIDCDEKDHPSCSRRKRRDTSENCEDDDSCDRKRREACKVCEDNPDSTECIKCRG